MSECCCICQEQTNTRNKLATTKVGEPLVLLKDLLQQCLGNLDILSTNAVRNDGGMLCECCVAKLLEFYEATLKVAAVQAEFHKRVKLLKLEIDSDDLESRVSDFDFEDIDSDWDDRNLSDGDGASHQENTNDSNVRSTPVTDKLALEEIEDNKPLAAIKLDLDQETSERYCRECEVECPSKEVLQLHIEKFHSGIVTESKNKSKKKAYVHKVAKPSAGYICEQCGKSAYTQSALNKHIQSHDNSKNFACSDCGKRFKTAYLMRHHMAWHTGERSFECDICQKRFVHGLALKRHKSIHDEQTRRKECKVCGFKFRTSSHLQRHMLTHTGVKPHCCPICGKCYAQRYNLRVHIQEHEQPGSTRQRRLKCKKCTRTFTSEENYREHCERNDCEAASTT